MGGRSAVPSTVHAISYCDFKECHPRSVSENVTKNNYAWK